MYRGTTPTFTFNVPDDVFLTEASNVYVTFAQMDETVVFTKESPDLTITDHSVQLYLTQEDTLKLPNGRVKVQLNWLYEESGVTKRACTKITTIDAKRNLIDEVLP